MMSNTAKAAAQAKWFPPKVVPNWPYTGVNLGEISTAPMGKPLPMPLATVIKSGFTPKCWWAKNLPERP